MATVTNKMKVFGADGKIGVIRQKENGGGKKADVCWVGHLVP
jgi:hypothetical protein